MSGASVVVTCVLPCHPHYRCELYPESVKLPDKSGHTALHHLLDGTPAPFELVEYILALYPEAVKIKDPACQYFSTRGRGGFVVSRT